MEILQTIWTALTNENELVLILTGIPMIFIEITVTLLLFTRILNIHYNKKSSIIYILSNFCIVLLSTYCIPQPFNTFINILALPVLVYFILKTNLLKAILSEVLVYTILFIFATPLVSIYTIIFKVSSASVITIPIHKMLYSIMLYILLLLMYKIIKKHNFHITYFDKFDALNYNTLISNFIIGLIAIALQAYVECFYIDYLPIPLVLTSIIVLVIYFCISLYSLFRTSKLEETKQLLETEKMYNKNLNTLHDNIRGFKHDFNNIVQSIGGYLSTNNIDGLKVYYKDLLEECQINNNLAVLNPELINNPAIYSLLADKYNKAEEDNIKLNLEIMADLSNLNIKTYELTRILGILFDNALDAASKCDKKIVNISFRNDASHNRILIIIQNTYKNKDINIDKIFEKGYSSKENINEKHSHGLGLWEVRKYLKKNTNLDLYTTKNDEFFTQQFEIYK